MIDAVREFLYAEARLLDQRAWHEWLALWAEDGHYVMPTQWTVLERSAGAGRTASHVAAPAELHYFDESMLMLQARVAKLDSGRAWAEEPSSITTRLIGNIEVQAADHDLIGVHSVFQLYRSRLEQAPETFIGRREDVLRPVQESFEIVRRLVLLNAPVLECSDLEIFF
jgi:3-phenylpropionate/cinnamic acid dioxygenase small subunit